MSLPETVLSEIDYLRGEIRLGAVIRIYFKVLNKYIDRINEDAVAEISDFVNLMSSSHQTSIVLAACRLWDSDEGVRSLPKLARFEKSLAIPNEEFIDRVGEFENGHIRLALMAIRAEGFAHSAIESKKRDKYTVMDPVRLRDVYHCFDEAQLCLDIYCARHCVRLDDFGAWAVDYERVIDVGFRRMVAE